MLRVLAIIAVVASTGCAQRQLRPVKREVISKKTESRFHRQEHAYARAELGSGGEEVQLLVYEGAACWETKKEIRVERETEQYSAPRRPWPDLDPGGGTPMALLGSAVELLFVAAHAATWEPKVTDFTVTELKTPERRRCDERRAIGTLSSTEGEGPWSVVDGIVTIPKRALLAESGDSLRFNGLLVELDVRAGHFIAEEKAAALAAASKGPPKPPLAHRDGPRLEEPGYIPEPPAPKEPPTDPPPRKTGKRPLVHVEAAPNPNDEPPLRP